MSWMIGKGGANFDKNRLRLGNDFQINTSYNVKNDYGNGLTTSKRIDGMGTAKTGMCRSSMDSTIWNMDPYGNNSFGNFGNYGNYGGFQMPGDPYGQYGQMSCYGSCDSGQDQLLTMSFMFDGLKGLSDSLINIFKKDKGEQA